MKTIDEIIAKLENDIREVPEYCKPDADPFDFYCGNEDDARSLGQEVGSFYAKTDLLAWIKK